MVSGLTGKNINLPILGNVLIKADEQKVEIISTNLEIAISVHVRAKTELAGSFTVPARTLTDFINLLPTDKVDVELKNNELVVVSGKSSTRIKGMSAEEFPVIPKVEEGKGYVVSAKELKNALAQVLTAVAKNDIRPELSGIFLKFSKDSLVLAATDSYRLAEKKIPLMQAKEDVELIVPGRTAQEIQHAIALIDEADAEGGVRILVSDNQLMINYGNTQIVSRLVEGNYPDYTQIIPKEFVTTVVMPTDRAIKEMKSAGLFTTTGVNAVVFAIDPGKGSVGVKATSTQTGDYSSEISGEISGGENTVLLNNRYVLDGLNNISSPNVIFKMINADSPCVFSPEGEANYLYIVMPIRQ